MAVLVTVLIPTFDHGPTLRYAAESVLGQTVRDLELFIVGDGAPPEANRIASELYSNDSRVRYFNNPKGPRHGEIHRHSALAEASGQVVCYLSDDDLWLPEHLEGMLEQMGRADFTHSLPTGVRVDGSAYCNVVDLSHPADRQLLLSGVNRVPLSMSGHTLAAYRQLPDGWRTTPAGVATDLYMYQQFLAQPWVRAVSGVEPTSVQFASTLRAGWTVQERCTELARWTALIEDGKWRRTTWPRMVRSAQAHGWQRADVALRVERSRGWIWGLRRSLLKALRTMPRLERLVRRLAGRGPAPPTNR